MADDRPLKRALLHHFHWDNLTLEQQLLVKTHLDLQREWREAGHHDIGYERISRSWKLMCDSLGCDYRGSGAIEVHGFVAEQPSPDTDTHVGLRGKR